MVIDVGDGSFSAERGILLAEGIEGPRPTIKLILELTNRNLNLLRYIHYGLVETPPLKHFNPYLDLIDTLTYASSSWKLREHDLEGFTAEYLSCTSLYAHFDAVCGVSRDLFNTEISAEFEDLYRRLNPFEFKEVGLEARLARLEKDNPQAVEELKKSLQKPVLTHVFEDQYSQLVKERGGNEGIMSMGFDSTSDQVVELAKNIAGKISSFPLLPLSWASRIEGVYIIR
ncbi:hypothetical protein KY347_06030 [Candidatus Woesearchaeota archaeon]|nr:hypothetical protein [Candidatus Woesearchaeota archaeon]